MMEWYNLVIYVGLFFLGFNFGFLVSSLLIVARMERNQLEKKENKGE